MICQMKKKQMKHVIFINSERIRGLVQDCNIVEKAIFNILNAEEDGGIYNNSRGCLWPLWVDFETVQVCFSLLIFHREA